MYDRAFNIFIKSKYKEKCIIGQHFKFPAEKVPKNAKELIRALKICIFL